MSSSVRARIPSRRMCSHLAAVLVVALVAGCGGGAKPGEPSAPSIDDPITVSTVGDPGKGLAMAEAAFRQAAREPMRSALGDEAERAFSAVERAVLDAAADLRTELEATGNAESTSGRAFGPVLAAIAFTFPVAQAEIVAGGLVTVAAFGISVFADKPSGLPGAASQPNAGIDIEVSGDRVAAHLDHRLTGEFAPGFALTEHTTGVIEALMCPDADGHVTITIDVETQATVTNTQGGQIDHQLHLVGTATATVNDEADVAEIAVDVTTGSARQQRGNIGMEGAGDSPDSFVEVQSTGRWGAGDSSAEANARITRESSNANTVEAGQLAEISMNLVNNVTRLVLDKAESLWKGGHCVEIVLNGANDDNHVAPGDELRFDAKVMHRFDGNELIADVSAELSGEKSLDPTMAKSKVSYTYTAGDKPDSVATALLETRSRRGIATKEVRFTSRGGWEASSEGGRISITGTVSDITAPFTLEGVFEGGEASLTFVPTNEHGGSYTYTGGGSGVTVSGGGTYTLEGNEGEVLTLRYSGNGCANPGGCANTSAVVTLTPQD